MKDKTEEEMRDLADTVEMATLDKEMAEERVSGVCEMGREPVVWVLQIAG